MGRATATSSPRYRIDEQLAKALDRKVWLPSGGSLVIDRTEAMTVVDVNTGKFTGAGGNLEETVTENNLEAAEEIVRQLRLRDIGGIIVVDFIDMVLETNRDLVLRRLLECLGRDRTKHQVAEVTSLGLVQMTRKRVGQGLLEVFSETCELLRRPRGDPARRAGREAPGRAEQGQQPAGRRPRPVRTANAAGNGRAAASAPNGGRRRADAGRGWRLEPAARSRRLAGRGRCRGQERGGVGGCQPPTRRPSPARRGSAASGCSRRRRPRGRAATACEPAAGRFDRRRPSGRLDPRCVGDTPPRP